MSFTITGQATDLDLDVTRLPTATAQVLAPWTAEDGTLRTSHAAGRFDETGALVKDDGGPWVIGAPEAAPMHLKISGLPSLRFPAPVDGATVDLADLYADNSPLPAPTPTAPYVRGAPGPSAYEVAVAEGFVGTEAEWLHSLAVNDVTDEAAATLISDSVAGPQTQTALDAFVGESTATFRAALSESNTWQQNSDALNAAADAAEAAGGGRVIASPGVYDVKGVVVGSRVTLDMPGVTLRSPDGQAPNVITTKTQSTSATASGATLTVGDAADIEVGSLVAVHHAGKPHPSQSTFLTANIDSTQTTGLELAVTKGWPTYNGHIRFGSEIIQYASRSGGVLSGVTRGVAGTTAASHLTTEPAHLATHHYGIVAAVSGTTVTIDGAVSLNVTGSTVTVGSIGMTIAPGLVIDGNSIPGGSTSSVYGLTLTLCRRAVVDGLTVKNGDMGGVMVVDGSRDNFFSSTTILDSGIHGVKGAGMWCFASASRNTFDGLRIEGPIWTGIYIDDRTRTATPWDGPCDGNTVTNFIIEHTAEIVGYNPAIAVVGSNDNKFAFGKTSGTSTGIKVEHVAGQTSTHDGSFPPCSGNHFSNIHVSARTPWSVAGTDNFLHGLTFDDDAATVDPNDYEGNLTVNSKIKRGEAIVSGITIPTPDGGSPNFPGYSFDGKTGTGMYSDASNAVGLSAARTNVVRAFPTEIRFFQGVRQTRIHHNGAIEMTGTPHTPGAAGPGQVRLQARDVEGVLSLIVVFPDGQFVTLATGT